MGRDQIDRQLEREEERLSTALDRGLISPEECRAEMRQLQRDASEAYQQGMDEAFARVRDEWS